MVHMYAKEEEGRLGPARVESHLRSSSIVGESRVCLLCCRAAVYSKRERGGGVPVSPCLVFVMAGFSFFLLALVLLAYALPKGLDGGESVLAKCRRPFARR